jgi:hypothetical protein
VKLSLPVVNALVQNTTRDLSSLTTHIVEKLEEDPDLIDTQWFENKARQRDKLKDALDELHAYKRDLLEEKS